MAGLVLSSLPAKALVYSTGDILVGFRATAGDGTQFAYLVNLGSYNQFTGNVSFELTALSAGIGADLTAIYGDGWNTSADVSWSVFGGRTTGNTLYSSRQRDDVSIPSTPWEGKANGARGGTLANINSAGIAYAQNGTNGGGSYTPVNLSAGIQPASYGQGYVSQLTTGVDDFGSTSGWSNIEGTFANGTAGSILDFYVTNSAAAATRLGSFSINDNGVLTFTAAVPEPSTYALLAIAGTAFLVFLRRQKQARA